MTIATLDKEYAQLLAVVQPKVIETEAENEFYLSEVTKLMRLGDAISPAQERLLKLLVNLIESFESQHYQLKPATSLEILTELVRDRGLKQKDLLLVFGSQGVASEVLNGKRGISKSQAKALGEFFKVSPSLFFDN
ncbi:helix-turn-helix domain-containing protein [Chamaesiphon minutus]|uniref:Putative transcription regulator containing HTH domain n=1 Tax=Chamaesiphon minutus (strain ATCC 27169 / PCC 6605) TaxID=1173020 RepID=K9UPB0_CHAP6|nr:transcription regulator containing HTH domain [Chamaesiphon minutus]AFY96655.1 putative transcription regulator containing HTH domain [Chamaesiphon minutus PCC 6605]